MFNFLAAALMVYLMVNVLIAPGIRCRRRAASSRRRLAAASSTTVLGGIGIAMARSAAQPLASCWRLSACVGVWVYLWHTPWGYELRTVGQSAGRGSMPASSCGASSLSPCALSGALAGFVGVNEIMGVHHRLLLNFVAGYGFAGIAVALMGRNHPLGIVLAGLLFGVLQPGRRRARLRNPRDHARDGRGDPGPDDPVLRRACQSDVGPGSSAVRGWRARGVMRGRLISIVLSDLERRPSGSRRR